MKPNELIKDTIGSHRSYSDDRTSIYPYLDEDRIIVYYKDKCGLIFIIKTKRKYMAFNGFNDKIETYWRNFQRLDVNKALSFVGDDWKVVNENEFKLMKDKLLIKDI